jgi:hypothetical protein
MVMIVIGSGDGGGGVSSGLLINIFWVSIYKKKYQSKKIFMFYLFN